MDRFMNMTSTMTNWWSSVDKKNEKGENDGKIVGEDEENVEGEKKTMIEGGGGGGEKAKDEEDGSPETSEADTVSNQSEKEAENTTGIAATSVEGEADEQNEGGGGENSATNKSFGQIQVGINEVSTKAIESAKNIGSFLFSVANKAGKTVTETAKHIKHSVEENSILGEFNKEQEAFVKEKNFQHTEAAVPPWVGYGEEELLKQHILSLSLDRRNFLRCPPSGVQFQFDFDAMYPIAMATLAEDPNLEKIRFDVVPKLVNEENFWKNYFYRVSLIKQSTQLSSLAQETSDSSGHSSRKSSFEGSAKGSRLSSVDDKGDLSLQMADSPTHEFVSDAFQGNVDKEELRKGMQQLGMKGNEEEWEKEVQQELQEYEVVMGGKEANLVEDSEWEKEIQQMLEAEMTSSHGEKK